MTTITTPSETHPATSRILACTDGSAYAPSVYDHAAWAAQQLKASIHVLHLVDPHHKTTEASDLTGAIGLGAKSALMEELVQLEATKAKLAHAKGRIILDTAREHFAQLGIHQIIADQKHGSLADSIETYDTQADLVVIGKRGENTALDRKHLGSNLERVVRTCKHPVLVAARTFNPIQRVLIAYDAGPSVTRAIDYIISQPLLQGTQIHLLSVGSSSPHLSDGITATKTKLETAGFSLQYELLPGHPIEVISQTIEKNNIDLLIMGAYGHMHIRHLLIGSTTATLLRTCTIPFLLFR